MIDKRKSKKINQVEKISTEKKQDFSKEKSTNESVNFYGKVAKFPNNVKPSKAYSFLEKIKVNPDKLWYMMIQRDNDLQMIKYNTKAGVVLNEFVEGLKEFYLEKWKDISEDLKEQIKNMTITGEDKYAVITVPMIQINGRHLINIIAEDLVKILRNDDKN
jgi:hypothetical protein